ncbi:MAG: DNA polymerase III subunit beta [Clostridia bacterium]|nr:DNA polymerase III subunit beta [Clostridia bacterium]
MKIICNTLELSEACQNVQRAASNKTAIPAIEGILMVAKEGTLTLTGYDLEMGITTSIPAKIEEEGELVLNAHMFSETLRKLPDVNVSIDSDARHIATISCGDFESTLIGISAEEYPDLPSVSGGYPISVNQDILKDMIRKTIFSAAIKDSKIVHTGIKFEIEENHIRLIAVDGVRLAIRNENISYEGESLSFVVPAKTLSEVTKLMNDDDAVVNLGVGKRHIIFEVNGYNIISRLLDGEFLNYKAAIPSATKTVINVNTRSLIDSIDRTSLIITDKIKSPVKCIFGDNLIKISSITSLGTANDKISASIEGESCTIGFNNKYMLDALKVCDTDEVRIMLNGPVAPILIVPNEGDEFIFLILPVRLKNED